MVTMRRGTTIKSLLNNIFQFQNTLNTHIPPFNSNEIFKLFGRIDTTYNTFEIPIFLKRLFEFSILPQIKEQKADFKEKIDEYVCNILNTTSIIKKTPNSLIKYIINDGNHYDKNIISGILENNMGMVPELYYIKGMFLDKYLNVLTLCTLSVEYDESNLKANYYTANCYVNSKVFIEQDIAVNKFIIKEFLPFFIEKKSVTFSADSYGNFIKSYYPDVPVNVQIKNDDFFEQFIVKPIKPKYLNRVNDDLNKILRTNIETALIKKD